MLSLLWKFELQVTAGNTLMNLSTLCRRFNFSGIKQFRAAIECENAISGDKIVVKKTDQGAMRLELLPICSCIISKIKKNDFKFYNDKQQVKLFQTPKI